MRRSACVFALVACAGCSALFDMGAYDRGEKRANAVDVDGGRSGDVAGGDDAGGGALPDAAGGDAGTCVLEDEPNDDELDAEELPVGRKTCGELAGFADVDNFIFASTTPTTVEFTVPDGVQILIFRQGDLVHTSSGITKNVPLTAGEYELQIRSVGEVGPYVLLRE